MSSDSLCEMLIECVREHPILYRPELRDHCDIKKIWVEITNKCNFHSGKYALFICFVLHYSLSLKKLCSSRGELKMKTLYLLS